MVRNPSIDRNTLATRLSFTVLVLAIKLLLSMLVYTMKDAYAYYGMVFDPRPMAEQALSIFGVALAAMLTETRVYRLSNALHFALFIACLLPVSVEYDLNVARDPLHYWPFLAVFILIPIVHSFLRPRHLVRPVSLTPRQFLYVAGLLFAGLMALVLANYGFRFGLGGLDALYDQREVYKSESNRLSEYAFNWLVYVLNPALLMYSLWRRIPVLTVLTLGLSVYFFGLGGHKAALMIAPLAFVVYFFYRIAGKQLLLWLTGGLALVLALFLLLDLSMGTTSLPTSIFTRRGLILPAQIYFNYAEFFSSNPLNLFSHNLPFSLFIGSPYADRIPTIIGEQYYGFLDNVYANGNVFADAFANIGMWSFLFLTIVLPLIYSVIDRLSVGKSAAFLLPLVFVASINLINSGLIVSFITHGILIVMLMLFLAPKPRFAIQPSKS